MARTQLGRAAAGLPRYYMDTGWWRARRFTGLPLDALGLVRCIVSHGNEHATDGHVPADPEDLAAAVGLRARDVRKALKPLLEREVLARDGDELVLVGWSDHNPTKADVEAYTAERSTLGGYGNHVRHHEQKGVRKDGCEWCDQPPTASQPGRSSDPGSDPPSDPEPVAASSHGMGWELLTHPQTGSTTRPRHPATTTPASTRPPASSDAETTTEPEPPAPRSATTRPTGRPASIDDAPTPTSPSSPPNAPTPTPTNSPTSSNHPPPPDRPRHRAASAPRRAPVPSDAPAPRRLRRPRRRRRHPDRPPTTSIMITRLELTRRLTRARIHLDHRVVAGLHGTTSRRATAARDDVARVLQPGLIDRAHRHLADHQAAGLPSSSAVDASGSSDADLTYTDRTGSTATGAHDPIAAEAGELDDITARLEVDSLQLLRPDALVANIARRLEEDSQRVRWSLLRWAREPDIRWCEHCRITNGHREPVLRGKYKNLCLRCGEWRATNKALPHADILPYLQRGEAHRIPRSLLSKHHVKLPRVRRRAA
jgi:hypothetical protein